MSKACKDCRHLKEDEFTYGKLAEKWQELYDPSLTTAGYLNKFNKEAVKTGQPFTEVKLTYVYCAEGILNRLYIKRGKKEIEPTPDRLPCVYFASLNGGNSCGN